MHCIINYKCGCKVKYLGHRTRIYTEGPLNGATRLSQIPYRFPPTLRDRDFSNLQRAKFSGGDRKLHGQHTQSRFITKTSSNELAREINLELTSRASPPLSQFSSRIRNTIESIKFPFNKYLSLPSEGLGASLRCNISSLFMLG